MGRMPRKVQVFSLVALGDAIRAKRLELGLSQEELGQICKLDRTYISGVENGRRNPTVTCVDSVARALGITLQELVDLSGESFR